MCHFVDHAPVLDLWVIEQFRNRVHRTDRDTKRGQSCKPVLLGALSGEVIDEEDEGITVLDTVLIVAKARIVRESGSLGELAEFAELHIGGATAVAAAPLLK